MAAEEEVESVYDYLESVSHKWKMTSMNGCRDGLRMSLPISDDMLQEIIKLLLQLRNGDNIQYLDYLKVGAGNRWMPLLEEVRQSPQSIHILWEFIFETTKKDKTRYAPLRNLLLGTCVELGVKFLDNSKYKDKVNNKKEFVEAVVQKRKEVKEATTFIKENRNVQTNMMQVEIDPTPEETCSEEVEALDAPDPPEDETMKLSKKVAMYQSLMEVIRLQIKNMRNYLEQTKEYPDKYGPQTERMSVEINEQLNYLEQQIDKHGSISNQPGEVERLRKELDQLKEEKSNLCEELQQTAKKYRDEAEAHKKDTETYKEEMKAHESKLSELYYKFEKLMKVVDVDRRSARGSDSGRETSNTDLEGELGHAGAYGLPASASSRSQSSRADSPQQRT